MSKPRVTKSFSIEPDVADRMDAAKKSDPTLNWTQVIVAAIEAELARRTKRAARS